jgi:hypothetical protein
VATDGGGLLAFIRAHTLSEQEQEELAATVRRLGAGDYEARQEASRALIRAGRPALPFLRPALDDPDLEVARRARRCVQEIEMGTTSSLMMAAARLVSHRRPAGAVPVLLAYLPLIDEDVVEETWFEALRTLGLPEGGPDPALLAALADKRPIRRAAAAHILGQAPSADVRRRVRPLLNDRDARVRYEAAAALLPAGEKEAVPVLAVLLTEAPLPIAGRAERRLLWLADAQAPVAGAVPEVGLGVGAAERRECRRAWESWWRGNRDRVDLSRLKREEPLRGLTVVCEYDGDGGGRVWEYGQDGRPRWEVTRLEGPNDVQVLPGGRLLIAERNANRVTERDRQGKVLWRHRTSGNPVACQRLPDGNTLVATFNELYEVTADDKKVKSHTHRMGFRHAVRLPNGHVLYITSNGLVEELDAAWKREVRSVRPAAYAAGASYWASIEPLANGRYLLALGGAGRVVEMDAAGKVRWECSVPSAVCATRLRNGHTLVSSFEGRCLVEVDRDGKEVSKQTLRGRPFTVRRY